MPTLQQDFTRGPIGPHLVRFSIPFLLSNFVQSLYSVADMYIVGLFDGAEAIAGVTIGGQITMIVSVVTIGLAMGGSVLIAQYFGAERMRDVSETIGTIFSFLVLLSVAVTVVMLLLSRPMLALINTPPEAFRDALVYLRICLCGNAFIFGYNAISAIQRGLGDSKRPLFFVSIACAVNIGLDFLMIGGLGLGAAGAALATITAQAFSMALAMLYLRRRKYVFDFKRESFRIHWDKVRLIFRIGLPSSVQNVLVHISFLLMTTLVNGFGVYASAAVGIVGRFNSFAIMPASAMSMSISSMTGQNVGAGLHDRARRIMFVGMAISLLISAVLFILSQLFPGAIIAFFSDEPEVVAFGIRYLRGFSFDYLVVPFAFCFTGLITGSGHTAFSMFAGCLTSLLLRIPVAWLFSTSALGIFGIGLAAPIASLGSVLMSCWFVMSGRWKRNVTGIQREAEAFS
ncbi:MAG: MATE family efflux transporter [Clostridia bacterium]|nr:MATE family efflux transporter [Clostridia bacterium]